MEAPLEERRPTLPAGRLAVPATETPADRVQEFLASAPPEQRAELAEVMLQSISAKSYRGPLPPPEDLEQYCKLIPNGGDRIMTQYEQQVSHRIKLEETTVRSQLSQSGAGQWMGFALGLAGLGLSAVCVCNNHDLAGAALGGTTLIGLVSVFVLGRNRQHQSLTEKDPS